VSSQIKPVAPSDRLTDGEPEVCQREFEARMTKPNGRLFDPRFPAFPT
jgi:hypothetical protein